jgi:DNA protecting protein DprA
LNLEISMTHYPIYRFKSPYSSSAPETRDLEHPCDLPPHLGGNLWDVPHSPPELFIQGSKAALKLLEKLPDQGLAIVGTRQPQPRSLSLIKKAVHELSGSGLVVISGLARGIDSAAHQASLEARIPTIAILGTGHHLSYPRENELLRQKILSCNGLIISEFPPHSTARSFHFLKRNRLIAGWAKATLVVEAPFRSGALNTARWARELNRTCFTVPCFPGDPALSGNQTLLDRDHALAFWGSHSLGSVWMELATWRTQKTLPLSDSLADSLADSRTFSPDESLLIRRIHEQTCLGGGIALHDLMDWATEQGCTPARFFSTIQAAIEKRQILDRQGILCTSSQLSV